MFFLSFVGLGLIIAGWTVQLMQVLKGEKQIQKQFILLYVAGVVLLIIGQRDRGLDLLTILNIASAVLATLVYIKLK